MKYHIKDYRYLLIAIIFGVALLLPISIFSQNYTLLNNEGEVMVTGTSTLHDWEEVAEQKSGNITIDIQDEVLKITSLKLKVVAESLKSGKATMDKNTYKALKTDSYTEIIFQLTDVKNVSTVSLASGYKVTVVGNLTIAGKTNKTDLNFSLKSNDEKVVLKGKKSLKMTDYSIEPPKALMGTIKTGDEIEVHYNTVWTK